MSITTVEELLGKIPLAGGNKDTSLTDNGLKYSEIFALTEEIIGTNRLRKKTIPFGTKGFGITEYERFLGYSLYGAPAALSIYMLSVIKSQEYSANFVLDSIALDAKMGRETEILFNKLSKRLLQDGIDVEADIYLSDFLSIESIVDIWLEVINQEPNCENFVVPCKSELISEFSVTAEKLAAVINKLDQQLNLLYIKTQR